MFPGPAIKTAPFDAHFFPQHLALLTVGENMMPMGYWTAISKDPFRFLICMGVGNYSLTLLKKYREAALHFMPWSERERVVRAGYLSGRDTNKAEKFAPFVMDVVASNATTAPVDRQPILFFSKEDFATPGERWQYQK